MHDLFLFSSRNIFILYIIAWKLLQPYKMHHCSSNWFNTIPSVRHFYMKIGCYSVVIIYSFIWMLICFINFQINFYNFPYFICLNSKVKQIQVRGSIISAEASQILFLWVWYKKSTYSSSTTKYHLDWKIMLSFSFSCFFLLHFLFTTLFCFSLFYHIKSVGSFIGVVVSRSKFCPVAITSLLFLKGEKVT